MIRPRKLVLLAALAVLLAPGIAFAGPAASSTSAVRIMKRVRRLALLTTNWGDLT
jgi:hypothetical protein